MEQGQIFIVDDSPVQLIILEKVLKNQGFSVKTFSNGQTMIEQLRVRPPSLIISDIEMPDLNGFELIEAVRETLDEQNIPFFFMSSYEDKILHEKARKAGALVFLHKPFKYHTLLDLIKEKAGLAQT